ncbi:MAG: precorrin-3B C(17)-methyltransferase [Rhodococcus sp. (in: high G+C Gram-positive bacteria)]
MTGKLWGVGIGPGDSELVTVKGARVIGEVDVVAFHSARGSSIARATAEPYMREDQIEEHLVYPVTTGTTDHPLGYDGAIADFYTEAAERLAVHLEAGLSVALLAAGDPLFYSSYQHMHVRLADRFDTEIIPGVTSVSAASAAMQEPLVEGDEVLTILSGTLPVPELTRRLRETDSAAILKLGRTFPAVRQALRDSGRLSEARYVERASKDTEKVSRADDVDEGSVPYFSIAVVPSPSYAPDTSASAGEVVVVGLGPGTDQWTTPQVRDELAKATDLVGYTTYIDRVPERRGQKRHASDNRVESERAEMALDLASRGARVAVVSSGDPGVFAMASAVLEVAAQDRWRAVPVRVCPGVTAANAVASRVGAPLGHDYAVISLSDRLKPWDVVERRLHAVAAADMAFAVYNPASRTRTWQVEALKTIALEYRGPDTPVVVGRDVSGPEESVTVVRLGDLDATTIDMRCLLIVGASTTSVDHTPDGPRVFTSRRYVTDAGDTVGTGAGGSSRP